MTQYELQRLYNNINSMCKLFNQIREDIPETSTSFKGRHKTVNYDVRTYYENILYVDGDNFKLTNDSLSSSSDMKSYIYDSTTGIDMCYYRNDDYVPYNVNILLNSVSNKPEDPTFVPVLSCSEEEHFQQSTLYDIPVFLVLKYFGEIFELIHKQFPTIQYAIFKSDFYKELL